MHPRKLQAAILVPTACFLLQACDGTIVVPSNRARELAVQAENGGEYPRAIRLYEHALEGTSRTADLHYRLAILYDTRLDDPVSALHHYQRHLETDPDIPPLRKEEIERTMSRLRRDLVIRIGESGLISRSEAVRLRNENLELRKQLAAYRDRRTGAAAAAAAVQADPDTRTHTVRAGDTLASISRSFYKTPNRWQDIAEANGLDETTRLQEGQVLIIP